MAKDIILIMGSKTDRDNADKILIIWKELGVDYRVAIASCHKHGGGDFAKFIISIKEKLIVFLGGMSLAAPGLIEVINKKVNKIDTIVFGIPTDKAAQSALEDLPKGTAIITSGLNQISISHSLVNSALSTAKLAGMLRKNTQILKNLNAWYINNLEKNPLIADIQLRDNGTIF